MRRGLLFFFFNDTATTEIYTLSLHDALPICGVVATNPRARTRSAINTSTSSSRWSSMNRLLKRLAPAVQSSYAEHRSEEHTSELQSRQYLVCRLLLEKKNKQQNTQTHYNGII